MLTDYTLATIFARPLDDGTGRCILLHEEDGTPVTTLGAQGARVYPDGSDLSAAYFHPNGIILDVDDAAWLGIEFED